MNWFSEHINIKSLWIKCKSCGSSVFQKAFIENLYVCPKCQHHHFIPVYERIAMLADKGKFKELWEDVSSEDFLDFTINQQKYSEKLSITEKKTGNRSAFIAARIRMNGRNVNLGVIDFKFFGGSMGSVLGEKFFRLAMDSIKRKRPLVVVSASGGARMQEGIMSLMQMAKTSAVLSLMDDAKIPFISVPIHPTTGGVSASFAMLGDVIIAEKGALIGFAGPRVIEQTIKQKLPDNFQKAEFLQECGMVDMVVHRKDLKDTIARILGYLCK
ncbi:MAG: acetyl-CoA carboxylase carboxyl transferase subunit beta [Candidatus Muiribacterium halophilum]|uniref:Acetyl-coenzyme A carboxylase carboxyl transferase subunit beta n=1 Tax=Muiribacterium halophilum TaxID=2053465 RepID=A0A2N5ZH84_MUIH1|nr:MAG: acetyl-CoA carboxylase carboxyl transferase subunit beta [Candidatus Muirbacterium halophilum]